MERKIQENSTIMSRMKRISENLEGLRKMASMSDSLKKKEEIVNLLEQTLHMIENNYTEHQYTKEEQKAIDVVRRKARVILEEVNISMRGENAMHESNKKSIENLNNNVSILRRKALKSRSAADIEKIKALLEKALSHVEQISAKNNYSEEDWADIYTLQQNIVGAINVVHFQQCEIEEGTLSDAEIERLYEEAKIYPEKRQNIMNILESEKVKLNSISRSFSFYGENAKRIIGRIAVLDTMIEELNKQVEQEEIENNVEMLSLERLEELYKDASAYTLVYYKETILGILQDEKNIIEKYIREGKLSENAEILDRMNTIDRMIADINKQIEERQNLHEENSSKNKEKFSIKNLKTNIKTNRNWFRKNAKKDNVGFSIKKKVVSTAVAMAGIVGILGLTNLSDRREDESKQQTLEQLGDAINDINNALKRTNTTVKIANEVHQNKEAIVQSLHQAKKSKEERIMDLVIELRDKLNAYEGINVTTEQTLSLYIHLNAANSYINKNDILALDKITREKLIKKYYVGLTEDMEEFNTYKITDDDLSKLSAGVQELRNAVLNRVIVLNDQKNYEESRELIYIFKDFITEEALQDEAQVLTDSVANMQTNDSKQQKKEIYRYYNYIFAGPKSEVRNFDDYGHYVDGDTKEMTFENQGTTVRFYTWVLDGFVDIHSNKGYIPQDIINSKTVKLMDQANLLRILGYKNCNAFNAYFGIDFSTPIDNKKTKTRKKSSSNSSSSNVAPALDNQQLDLEMNIGLTEHSQVGDSFGLSDGSTVTIVETGPNSTTVVVEPDPSSARTEDTTPEGPTQGQTTEGGGNETTESIEFPSDKTEEVIDEGGVDITPEASIEVQEQEEQSQEKATEESYTSNQIQELLDLKQVLLSQTTTYFDYNMELQYVKTYHI